MGLLENTHFRPVGPNLIGSLGLIAEKLYFLSYKLACILWFSAPLTTVFSIQFIFSYAL